VLVTLYWTGARAAQVWVLGSWDAARRPLPMARAGLHGFPALTLLLAPGRYTYRFLVDWREMHDPTQPSTKEGAAGRLVNWMLASTAASAAVLFRYRPAAGAAPPREVALVGTFTQWAPQAMQLAAGGCFEQTLQLGRGLHWFSFRADGRPALDPTLPAAAAGPDGASCHWRIV
jgi:hypothetical protein